MIPTNKGGDVYVVPLTSMYHQAQTILPGQAGRGVVPPRYPTGEINIVPEQQPKLIKEAEAAQYRKPKPIDPRAFMKGGGYLNEY